MEALAHFSLKRVYSVTKAGRQQISDLYALIYSTVGHGTLHIMSMRKSYKAKLQACFLLQHRMSFQANDSIWGQAVGFLEIHHRFFSGFIKISIHFPPVI
jgi:hypothetical protein